MGPDSWLGTFGGFVFGKLRSSLSLRGLFLKLFLKPLDFALEWLYLFFQIQALRLKNAHLLFRIFKLRVEREQLTALLLDQGSKF